jgi:hypothetical protein
MGPLVAAEELKLFMGGYLTTSRMPADPVTYRDDDFAIVDVN